MLISDRWRQERQCMNVNGRCVAVYPLCLLLYHTLIFWSFPPVAKRFPLPLMCSALTASFREASTSRARLPVPASQYATMRSVPPVRIWQPLGWYAAHMNTVLANRIWRRQMLLKNLNCNVISVSRKKQNSYPVDCLSFKYVVMFHHVFNTIHRVTFFGSELNIFGILYSNILCPYLFIYFGNINPSFVNLVL